MLHDGLKLVEGSSAINLTIVNGTEAERLNLSLPNNGELFYQTDGDIGTYVYDNNTWSKLVISSQLQIVDGGTF